jgi:phosphoglycolate phosphatase-like HAD superfamily hydrolase
MFKIIIFDFDGVILESMDIKTNALRDLFKDYPEHLDDIVKYHIKNGGVSRYKKFLYIYKDILKRPLNEDTLNELGERFSHLVLQQISSCPLVPGVQAFLEEYSKRIAFFIASGTPEGELNFLVKRRGLSGYFKGIYGTPALKSEIIEHIIGAEGVRREEAIFVGDAISDYEDAKKAGIPFVARINRSSGSNPFINLKVPIIRDFNDLKTILKHGDTL